MDHRCALVKNPYAEGSVWVCETCSAIVIDGRKHADAMSRTKTEQPVMTPAMIEQRLATPVVGMTGPTETERDLLARWHNRRIAVKQNGRVEAVGTVTKVATHHGTERFTLFFRDENGFDWQVVPGTEGWEAELV